MIIKKFLSVVLISTVLLSSVTGCDFDDGTRKDNNKTVVDQ